MLGMVDAGLGIAAIPAMALPAYAHHALVSIPLVEPEVKRQVGLIKKRAERYLLWPPNSKKPLPIFTIPPHN